MPKESSILKWENTAHITKMGIEGTVALASLAGAITAILIATKVIAGPASLALIASPAGIAVLFIAAVYFAAAAYVSYQQMYAIGAEGPRGKEGDNADFATLVSDVLKSGTIVEEKEGENDVQQLFLTLPIADYKELAKNNGPVHILLADGKVVELAQVALGDNATEYKVQITKVAKKTTVADMKAELGMTTDPKPLKVAVSDKDFEALKNGVSTKLGDVAVNAAIFKVQAV